MRNVLRLIVLAALPALSAQDCPRIVPVNVFSYYTHLPIPFQPERLQASIAGNPVAISSFEKAKGNRALLLVDISGSMQDAHLKEVVELLLEQFPLDSSFAYGFFSDQVQLSDGFSDPAEIKKALAQMPTLEITGRTALYDALDQALKLFQQPTPGDSILVISDGGDNHSQVRANAIRKQVMESRIRVFAIMPGPKAAPDGSMPTGSTFERDLGLLSELAEKSGGAIYPILLNESAWSDKKWRAPALKSIQNFWLEGVGGGYRITVMMRGDLKKPAMLKLRLNKSGDKQFDQGFLAYPEMLTPCSNSAAAVP